MAKATKPLGGTHKDKYFRDLFGSDPGLAPDVAKRLVETTKREVAEVRVRVGAWAERRPVVPGKPLKEATVAQPEPPVATKQASDAETATASATKPPFDPFAFTAVVVLKRQGAAALEKLLADIAEPDQLRLLADKQHLGLTPEAKTAAELRAAILSAAEARMADRRAAAS